MSKKKVTKENDWLVTKSKTFKPIDTCNDRAIKVLAEFAVISYGIADWLIGQENKVAIQQLNRFFTQQNIDRDKLKALGKDIINGHKPSEDLLSSLRASLLE